MVCPREHTDKMGDDQAHETYGPHEGNGQARQEGCENEENPLGSFHVHAQVKGVLFPQTQGVEIEAEEIGDGEAGDGRDERQLYREPVGFAQGADDPEQDPVEVLDTRDGHDQQHRGRGYEAYHDAREKEALKVEDRPVDTEGEKHDDARGPEKTESRQRVDAEQTGQAKYRAQGNTESRTARDAERIRLDERVPEHGLKHHSRKAEAAADGEAQKDPWEAYIEKDGVVGGCPLPPEHEAHYRAGMHAGGAEDKGEG